MDKHGEEGVRMATYRPPAKPRGLLKWGFHLPIALYRIRLGWLVGHRFLLLTHRGRKTGKLRRTMLSGIVQVLDQAKGWAIESMEMDLQVA